MLKKRKSDTVLAIDPGTVCGWALWRDGIISYGTWNLKPSRYDGGGMRYVRLLNRLDEIGEVDLVVFEEVACHLGTVASHIYGGIVAHIQAWCEKRNIAYTGVPVGTIKKHATGNGRSSKKQMEKAFRQKTGEAPITSDVADAYFLLDYAIKYF